MISVKWTPVFLKSVMRKNRHAVVLQFEIQATFGDGMGELRSKGTFFLYRTYLTMLLILKPCVGIIVSMLSFESFFNIVVFPALSSPRTRMRASSSERFNLRNKLSKPLKLKTNNGESKKTKNRERKTTRKSEQGQDIRKRRQV
jgi:hypothetical protein